MNEIIFDRKLLSFNRKRYKSHNANHNQFHHYIADKIYEDLISLNKEYGKVLELQAIDDYIYKLLTINNNNINYLTSNFDLSCDEEYLPFKPNSFDAVISNLNLQFINQIPFFIKQLYQILKKDAVTILTFFGEDNLAELSQAIYLSENEIYGGISSRMIPTIDIKTSGQLFHKHGFKNVTADVEKITVEFDSVSELLHAIKFMGFGNILINRSRKFFSKKLLAKTIQNYEKLYRLENLKIPATFKIITIIAYK